MADDTLYVGAGTISNSAIKDAAGISATKVIHQIASDSRQVNGSAVAAKTELIHTSTKSGTIGAFKVALNTAPTGGDLAFTVDLQKSTGGAAFATVLSAVVTINNTKSDYTVTAGTISSASYAAGDIFRIVWAVTGSTGTQGLGAVAEAFFQETA